MCVCVFVCYVCGCVPAYKVAGLLAAYLFGNQPCGQAGPALALNVCSLRQAIAKHCWSWLSVRICLNKAQSWEVLVDR